MTMLMRSEDEAWSDVPQAEWKSGAHPRVHHPEFNEQLPWSGPDPDPDQGPVAVAHQTIPKPHRPPKTANPTIFMCASPLEPSNPKESVLRPSSPVRDRQP